MTKPQQTSFQYNPEVPILIVGFGNPLMKDEGAGVFAIEELRKSKFPKNVTLIDGGTMGLEAITLFNEYQQVIVIDCIAATGIVPDHNHGFIEFTLDQVEIQEDTMVSAHDINLNAVLLMMINLKMSIPKLLFYGIIPDIIDYGYNTISDRVRKSVFMVVNNIKKLLSVKD